MRESRSLAGAARLFMLGASGALAWAAFTAAPALAEEGGGLSLPPSETVAELAVVSDAVVPVEEPAVQSAGAPQSIAPLHEVSVPLPEAVAPVADAVAPIAEAAVEVIAPVDAFAAERVVEPVVAVVHAADGTVGEVLSAPLPVLPVEIVEHIVPEAPVDLVPQGLPVAVLVDSPPPPAAPVLVPPPATPAATPVAGDAELVVDDDGGADVDLSSSQAPSVSEPRQPAMLPDIQYRAVSVGYSSDGPAASVENRPGLSPGAGVNPGSAATFAAPSGGLAPGTVPERFSLPATLPDAAGANGGDVPPRGPADDPGSTPD